MERIVVLERGSVRAQMRRPAFPHEWTEYAESTREQVAERLCGATIAIVNKIGVSAADLERLPELKLVAVSATGVDHLDLEACARRNVAVCNVRNYAGSSVAEHVLMLTLALRRRLLEYRAAVREGRWQKSKSFCVHDYEIHDLRGSTFGVIGYGALGRSTAELARAFGMNVLIAERKDAFETREGRTPFEEVLRRSDVVSLHAPLSEETRGLIGEKEFQMMKPSALLINTGRGALADSQALLSALREGKLAGAGVDVLSQEPPRDGSPLLDADLPNLIITPHVAWASEESMQRLADQLIDNIEAFVRGKPTNMVVNG